jgi:GMP synthase-like glutamine amidotransferase
MPEKPPPEPNDLPGVVLYNEDMAPPALLDEWLRERNMVHRTIRTWEEGVPDDPRDCAWVVALGASDSATQREPSWIPDEIAFLGRAVDADVPVLGICFGGQALSVALGGVISLADPISWGGFAIESEEPGLVPRGPWVHFNYEIFSVPATATQVARSPCGPGAFRVGPHLGIQFHPEVSPAIVDAWAESEAPKLAELGLTREDLLAQGEQFAEDAASQAFELFDAWRLLAAAPRALSATPGLESGRRRTGRRRP